MKRILFLLLIPCMLLTASVKGTDNRNEEVLVMPGKIVVKYKNTSVLDKVNNTAKVQIASKYSLDTEEAVFAKAKNEELKEQLNLNNVFVYEVSKAVDVQNMAKEISKEENVEYAEPVYISRVNAVPNDVYYSYQDYLPQVHAPEAWDIQYGSSDVIIGIIDTGVDWDHEDLENIIWTNTDEIPDNGIDDDGNGYIDDVRGWDFVYGVSGSGLYNSAPAEDGEDPDNDPMDFNGHGTHVSGIAAAETNNEIGIASVSSGARIMPLRCGWHAINGGGYVGSDFAAEAYVYAADNGAVITNQSSGNSGQLIIDAAYYAFINGVLVIEAAGNSAVESVNSIGLQDWAITVSSLDSNDVLSDFSNYGTHIDISAPGEMILSSVVEPSSLYSDYGYVWMSGTSMAAPLVASVAGLVKARYPDMNVMDLRAQVLQTADDIESLNPSYAGKIGSGKVNAYRALTETVNYDPEPSLQIEGNSISDASGNSNGILEPGESANLSIVIKNTWGEASNIKVTLSTDEDWPITINNNTATIGSIGSLLDQENSEATIDFPISCSELAYPTTVKMELLLSGTDVDDTLSFYVGVLPQVLFVADFENADDGEFDFSSVYAADFNDEKIPFDYVHTLKTDITYDLLSKYKVVVWGCEWNFPTLDYGDRAALEEYLDNGGALFLSGQDIAWELTERSYYTDVDFLNNYLKAEFTVDDADQSEIFGVEDDPITDGISSEIFQIRRGEDEQYPDAILPLDGATSIFKYGNTKVGGIKYDGDYNLVYFSFGGYESILDDEARRTVLRRTIDWLTEFDYDLEKLSDTEDNSKDRDVSIKINSDETITGIKLVYMEEGEVQPEGIVDMTSMGDGEYSASIPAKGDGTYVTYFVYFTTEEGSNITTSTHTYHVGDDNENPVAEILSNPLRNSINVSGIAPYELSVSFTDNLGIDSSTAELHYWYNDNSPSTVSLTKNERGVFSGTFSFEPRLNLGDVVNYYFTISDNSSNANVGSSDTLSYSIDSVQVIDDFDEEYFDWDVSGSWGLGTIRHSGSYSLSDSPTSSYAVNENTEAEYKMAFDLSEYDLAEITYYVRATIKANSDSLFLELSSDNGDTWSVVDTVTSSFSYFMERDVNISSYTGKGYDNVRLRFRLVTNAETPYDGVYIDDISIKAGGLISGVEDMDEMPVDYALSHNYPNPFNPTTTINYAVPVQSNVKITVYNVLGEVVKVLTNKQVSAGKYSIQFNASRLSSGIYFYRVNATGVDGSNFVDTKKMILLK